MDRRADGCLNDGKEKTSRIGQVAFIWREIEIKYSPT
jgi:hypothetical protein